MNTIDTSILIIYTGGTIGMAQDSESGALKPYDFSNIYQYVPELEKFNYHIDNISFDPTLDSSDITPDSWVKIAHTIKDNYESYDGFVVLHGSDTMAYTASALSFMLHNLSKPVVLTGSQLPMGMLRTDGRENLISAIEIAAAREEDTPIVPEVTIFFENKLYRGNRTYKYNAENFNAFVSGNYPILAESGVNLRFFRDRIIQPRFKKLKVYDKLDRNVALLKLFPGITERFVNAVINTKNLRALIIESFGSGNAPTSKWFLDAIKNAIDKGIVIVNLTQCLSGSVVPGKYETGIALNEMGVINGKDMTSSSALSKMMIALGRNISQQDIIKDFNKNWKGEIS
jgi:L-asparaginase